MNKKNDFYFWFSLILLFCLLFLVFYMYQEEFQFHEIVDTKTILAMLGTLGGAFFGAYFASRYSTNQVTRQLQHQKDLQQEQRLESELKYSSTSLAILISSRDYLNVFNRNLEGELTWEKLKDLLEDANHVLKREADEIKSINPIATLSFGIYRHVFPSLIMIDHVQENIHEFKEHCKKKFSLTDTVDSKELIPEIEDATNKLTENIMDILEEISKDVELKREVSQRLKI